MQACTDTNITHAPFSPSVLLPPTHPILNPLHHHPQPPLLSSLACSRTHFPIPTPLGFDHQATITRQPFLLRDGPDSPNHSVSTELINWSLAFLCTYRAAHLDPGLKSREKKKKVSRLQTLVEVGRGAEKSKQTAESKKPEGVNIRTAPSCD